MNREEVLELIDERKQEVTSTERLHELNLISMRIDQEWFDVDEDAVRETRTLLKAFLDSDEVLSPGQVYRVVGLDSREEAERVLCELERRGEAVDVGSGYRPSE